MVPLQCRLSSAGRSLYCLKSRLAQMGTPISGSVRSSFGCRYGAGGFRLGHTGTCCCCRCCCCCCCCSHINSHNHRTGSSHYIGTSTVGMFSPCGHFTCPTDANPHPNNISCCTSWVDARRAGVVGTPVAGRRRPPAVLFDRSGQRCGRRTPASASGNPTPNVFDKAVNWLTILTVH